MSKVRDFNLLKVADVSSNSTNTNSVSVVVNTDNSGKIQESNPNPNVNFTPPQPIFPIPTIPPETNVEYMSPSNLEQTQQQMQILEQENRFYKLLSSTLSNILRDNNPKLLINFIDQSGKVIIEAPTLIELIAIKTNSDPNSVNIQWCDEETNCLAKVSPVKNIKNIKIDNETFSLKYNREYNILKDDFNISLEKCIIKAFRRRERDSNSRYPFGVHTLSRRASSATRASLQLRLQK